MTASSKKRPGYVIGGEVFPTKQALIVRVREILYAYPQGDSLNDHDFAFMYALLQRHPDAPQKIGGGVTRIWTAINPVYPTRNFWLERLDGAITDFSFTECITETGHKQRFYRACRAAVAADIIAYKRQFFADYTHPCCPYTGQPLTLQNSHVDHHIPLVRLVQQFIHENSIAIDQVVISGKAEDQTFIDRFVDQDLERAWQAFHTQHADLRVISPEANLRRSRS